MSGNHSTQDPSTYKFKRDEPIETLLDRNNDWAKRFSALRPLLFKTLATEQHPHILWIGCSDSRVPETTILDLLPGEVFVHRNIANCLPPTDLSSLSVIQFAIEVKLVKHVIVCGHTSCGGCDAALGNKRYGLIDAWLKTIREVRTANSKELDAISDKAKRVDRLAELHVLAQVENLYENSNVIEAMKTRGLQVHGFMYDTATGHLRNLSANTTPRADTYLLEQ